MKAFTVGGCLVVLLLAACSQGPDVKAQAAFIRQAATDTEHSFLMHKPAGGCPAGWSDAERWFNEKDGSTRDGCIRPGTDGGEVRIDELLSGESTRL